MGRMPVLSLTVCEPTPKCFFPSSMITCLSAPLEAPCLCASSIVHSANHNFLLLIGLFHDTVLVRTSFLGGRRKLTEVQAAVGRDMRPFETFRIW